VALKTLTLSSKRLDRGDRKDFRERFEAEANFAVSPVCKVVMDDRAWKAVNHPSHSLVFLVMTVDACGAIVVI
jgi:hypothetical protein